MRASEDNQPAPLAVEIGELMRSQLLVSVDSPDEDLLATGALDSLTLIQLLVQLEERFGITISLEELDLDDVRSIRSIAHMVSQRKAFMAVTEVCLNGAVVAQKATGQT